MAKEYLKLTVEQLIKDKENIHRKKGKKKTDEVYLDQLDATVVIEEPDTPIVNEAIEIGQDPKQDSNGDDFLVYNVVVEPNLKDKELQKTYECKEPIDIVSALFDAGTVAGIAAEAMKLAGYTNGVTPVSKLKN